MKYCYDVDGGRLAECGEGQASVIVYENPSEQEKEELCRAYDLDPMDIEGVLDPDEVARVEFTPERTFVIWKMPDNVTISGTIQFQVSSLGIILASNRLVFIAPREKVQMDGRQLKRVVSARDCLLRVLFANVRHYQGHLKAIKQVAQELEAKLVTSMENRYLLQMFALGESLVYYHNAIETNQTVLGKIRAAAEKLGFTPEEIELMDDVMIENQQAGKQAAIYTSVLSGLMDARGTIINNNMNVLLKNLTIINVVFLPLNLIASILGMSEYSEMTRGIHWTISYGLFAAAMVILGWLTWWWLTRVLERQHMAGKGA
jgi:magnesium transporter